MLLTTRMIIADSCPQGDEPGKVYRDLSCSDLARREPWLCYNYLVRRKCCVSCPSVKEDAEGTWARNTNKSGVQLRHLTINRVLGFVFQEHGDHTRTTRAHIILIHKYTGKGRERENVLTHQ